MDRELLTKEAYLKKLSRRSSNTARGHKTSINTFENWHKTTDFIIANEPLKILGSFVDFLESQGKSARTINTYLNQLKKYFRLCYGIKLDAEDFKDFVGLPQILDEELEPLEKHELRLILESTVKPRRKALYWFISSTGCRISEALQVKKNNIDFSQNPPLVTLPIEITKGKRRTRYVYLTRENTSLIRQICTKIQDDDYIFTKAKNIISASTYEHDSFNRLLRNIGLDEKYDHNGRHKKNFHSIRAFTSSQIYDKTRDTEYAHAYIGHDTYLKQYLRKTPEKRAELFKEVESVLMVFDQIETTQESDELKEIKGKMEKYEMLDKLIANIEQPKLEQLLQNLSHNNN